MPVPKRIAFKQGRGNLRIGPIHVRYQNAIEGAFFHVAHDADNRLPWVAYTPLDMLPERAVWPIFSRHGKVHHSHRLGPNLVFGSKPSPLEQRNTHGLEIVPKDPRLANGFRRVPFRVLPALDGERNRLTSIERQVI